MNPAANGHGPDLRPYQVEAIDETRKLYRRGASRVVMALPTGVGKTVIACAIVRNAAAKGNRTTFITDRIVLAHQTSAVFDRYGIEHGLLQGNESRDTDSRVLIANAQTLESRGRWTPEGLVIIDEAHTERQFVESRLLKSKHVQVLGLTATPERPGFGRFWQSMYSKPTNWFIQHGYLCPYEIYGDEHFERSDPVYEWKKRFAAAPVKTIAYCSRINSAIDLAERFRNAGVSAAAIYAGISKKKRERVLAGFRDGSIHVVCNCSILVKGFDQPDVDCIVIDKSVNGLAQAMQIIGRGLRPAPGKRKLVVLDFTGMYRDLKFEIEIHYEHGFNTLDIDAAKRKAAGEDEEPNKPEGPPAPPSPREYLTGILKLDPGYDVAANLWPDTCRWTLDKERKDLKDGKPPKSEAGVYFRAVHAYSDVTGVHEDQVKGFKFDPAVTPCPYPIVAMYRKRGQQYFLRKEWHDQQAKLKQPGTEARQSQSC